MLRRTWDFDGPLVQAPVIRSSLGEPGRCGQRVHVRVHRVPMFIHFTIKSDYISLHGDNGDEQIQVYDLWLTMLRLVYEVYVGRGQGIQERPSAGPGRSVQVWPQDQTPLVSSHEALLLHRLPASQGAAQEENALNFRGIPNLCKKALMFFYLQVLRYP